MLNLTIAGPGAGKTTSLVGKVKEILGDLSENPYQFCAVITYTNAAAEEIRQRLQKEISIPSNIFIGTTHQFLIRFIIQPYGHLAKLPQEKLYIDEVKMTTDWGKAYKNQQKTREKQIAESLAQRGIIIYDKILEIADKLMSEPKVCNLVSERIKYLFIDEYQDTQLLQHQVFEKIYDKGKTKIYCIGDPLQSIYGFSYAHSQLLKKQNKPKFDEEPIQLLKKHKNCETSMLYSNHRSSWQIVELLKYYTRKVDLVQTSSNADVNLDIPVFFIKKNSLDDIVVEFNSVIEEFEATKEKDKLYKLFLAEYWKYLSGINNSHEIDELNYGSQRIENQFQEVKQCVLGALALKRKDIIELSSKLTNFEKRLSWRLFCLHILSELKAKKIDNVTEFIQKTFEEKYKKSIPQKTDDEKSASIQKSADKLRRSAKQKKSDSFYSSIHSAKGLEASCVLVYTHTSNQLEKWLNYENVDSDDDGYRLGYVAFSRARKILCVACRELPKKRTIKRMYDLGFEFR